MVELLDILGGLAGRRHAWRADVRLCYLVQIDALFTGLRVITHDNPGLSLMVCPLKRE